MKKEIREIINRGILYSFSYETIFTVCHLFAIPKNIDWGTREVTMKYRTYGIARCGMEDIPKYTHIAGKQIALRRALEAMTIKVKNPEITEINHDYMGVVVK